MENFLRLVPGILEAGKHIIDAIAPWFWERVPELTQAEIETELKRIFAYALAEKASDWKELDKRIG